MPEMDYFMKILNFGIETLETFLRSLLVKHFSGPMLSINWGTIGSCGDASSYVNQTIVFIRDHLGMI